MRTTKAETGPAIEHDRYLGTWVNTNSQSQGIARIAFEPDRSGVRLRVFGTGRSEPAEAIGRVYSEAADSPDGTALQAVCDLGFMEADLQTYIVKGVLVVVSLNRFKDGSGRSNYFAKEFFFKRENR